MPPAQYHPPGGAAHRIDLASIAVMLLQWLSLQAWRISKEGLSIFRHVALEFVGVAAIPVMAPYTVVASFLSSCQLALRDWSVRAQRRGRGRTPSGAIARALAQILRLVCDLPNTSPKYPFARSVAERILIDNAKLAPPLLHLNRAALGRAFVHSMQALEVALHRDQGSSWVGVAVQRALRAGGDGRAADSDADRAEKLARELQWMVAKMDECGGLEDVVALWSQGASLASAALAAPPRAQRPLVRLAASLCQAIGNGQVAAPSEARFQLLFLWLPLFCRATQPGDCTPVFNSFEKQETEEAIHKAIVVLPPGDREVLFATWLKEYAWSCSDWPDLQKAYSQWCDLARVQASVARTQRH